MERRGRNSIECDGSSVCDVEEIKGRDSQEKEREGEKQSKIEVNTHSKRNFHWDVKTHSD